MVIDTTLLSAAQLRSNIHDLFRSNDPDKDDFVVNCISFGFKFGVPVDADLMFDVRCLPNPFYDPNLRPMTGLDGAGAAVCAGLPENAGLFDTTV